MSNIFKIFTLFTAICFCLACSSGSGGSDDDDDNDVSNYREEMRSLVVDISNYAKGQQAGFLIIPQNGENVVVDSNDPSDTLYTDYFDAVDGLGREDLYYGYEDDDTATDSDTTSSINEFLSLYEQRDISVLVTDYTSTETNINDSYQQNENEEYISFAASRRELDNIPPYPAAPYNENNDDITTLNEAKNFLYILDPSNTDFFADKNTYLVNLMATNYDLFILDLFYNEEALTSAEVTQLKTKANGGTRLVIAYMSIGEAENYRYYWEDNWEAGSPDWIREENADFAGNFKVEYWNSEWQEILFGDSNGYLDQIIAAGFDGVYLDIIDAFEYFE